ncbi:MAG: hypothetical protein AAGI52_17325 [Bacteroidota bacterium]
METTTPYDTDPEPLALPASGQGSVYPITLFLRIQHQMKRLNLTPADCLQLLAEALNDLDRQITEFETEEDGARLPCQLC